MPETTPNPTVTEPTVSTDINLTPSASTETEPPATEDNLIAGKFKNQEELEKAYKELEAKLGEKKKEETIPPTTTEKEPVMVAGLPADKYFKEFADTGELSEASYKELSDKGISKSLVDAYIDGQKSITQQAQGLNDQTVNGLIDGVGGQDTFSKMAQWANTAYTEQEKADYTAAIDSGNVAAARQALTAMKLRYESTFGTPPTSMIEGTPPTASSAFRSKAEMVAAMKDSRYQTDPAYRRDVELKVMGMKF